MDPTRLSRSSSAIDLAGNRQGFISSNAMAAQPSVSPLPSPQSLSFNIARKRNSWGHADKPNFDPELSSEDPFYSPPTMSSYSTTQLSLEDTYDEPLAHLTSQDDPESQRRRNLRYTVAQSPLKKTGTAIKSVSNNLRRVSLRVVNLAGSGIEGIRLPDDDKEQHLDVDSYLSNHLPIRGRTLGFLGPTSRLRLSLYNFLVHPYVQRCFLSVFSSCATQMDGTHHPSSNYRKCDCLDNPIITLPNTS